jgi:hypothetical protein
VIVSELESVVQDWIYVGPRINLIRENLDRTESQHPQAALFPLSVHEPGVTGVP